MSRDREPGATVVGRQVRSAEGSAVSGEIRGNRPRGTLINHPRQSGHGPEQVSESVDAPDSRHMSGARWADPRGRSGLLSPGRPTSAPHVNADQT